MTMPKGFLEDLARAYDAEDSAQRGERDPWDRPLVQDYIRENGLAGWNTWRDERIACARMGVAALVGFLLKEPEALKHMAATYEAARGVRAPSVDAMRAAVEALTS